MTRIALGKIRDDRPPTEYRVRLDAPLNELLSAYRAFYVEQHNQEVEAKDLLEPIVRQFLANDHGFRAFRQRHRAAPAAKRRRKPLPNSAVGAPAADAAAS